ncbi:unnamed protein product [Sphenostylis stenocarpa]|uniref:Uncharacterized protein n=1 Tax=Sphenostylis stenocarpa TaxID=92480 RepID=A0AA86VXA3_9FABA|nr:unnamed protein product [Sphenostylis stenocarpa]
MDQKTSPYCAMLVDQDTRKGESMDLRTICPNILNLNGKRARLWSTKIPTRKRSEVVYKDITPMERFHMQLLKMSESHESTSEEVLLLNNVNNFIPSDEIGLGCVLLKPDA